jgi:hypothetical protein
VSFRIEFGGGAQIQFHTLPEQAKDADTPASGRLS